MLGYVSGSYLKDLSGCVVGHGCDGRVDMAVAIHAPIIKGTCDCSLYKKGGRLSGTC